MTIFITVKEAVERTGLSESAMRRVMQPIIKGEGHPDRGFIQPDPSEARELRLKGESFAWRISEELLDREMADRAKKAKPESKPTGGSAGQDHLMAMLQMLQKELDIKNVQIDSQTQLLRDFSERVREGNILIGSLQKQLAPVARQEAVDMSPANTSDEGATSHRDSADGTSAKKRNWLLRKLF